MNLGLEQKVVVITGGAKGIGLGITRAFAAEGAIACIVGRNPEEAEIVRREEETAGRRVESYHAEMTDEGAVRDAVKAIAERHGRIDVVVNNAGGNDAISLRHLRRIWDVSPTRAPTPDRNRFLCIYLRLSE